MVLIHLQRRAAMAIGQARQDSSLLHQWPCYQPVSQSILSLRYGLDCFHVTDARAFRGSDREPMVCLNRSGKDVSQQMNDSKTVAKNSMSSHISGMIV